MPSTTSLINKIKADFPQFRFEKGSDFHWSHSENTVYYSARQKDLNYLFHELAHALLGHDSYLRDIELISMERDAWEQAKTIAAPYKHPIDEDFIQDNLDTYREWLHQRSTCKKCTATGVQIKKNIYKCIVCNEQWRVNEARQCALRRYDK